MVSARNGSQESNDPLLRWVIGAAILLAMLYGAVGLIWRPDPTLPVLAWYAPTMGSFQALAASSIAFLAFGRYRVGREPLPFWVGIAFSSHAILSSFFLLTSPGLLPGERGIIAQLPTTSSWIAIMLLSTLVACLLTAVSLRWPQSGMAGERLWLWLALSISAAIVAIASLIVTFEQYIPPPTVGGKYISFLNVWRFVTVIAYGTTALLSSYRYRQTGDRLFGFVALTAVLVAFTIVAGFTSEGRYDLWWYLTFIHQASGLMAMLFGLLSEYVGLYRREREKSRELAALLQVTDPGLAQLGLERLLQVLLSQTAAIMGANAAAILLLDPERQEVALRAGVGIPEEEIPGYRVRVGEDFDGRVVARNAAFWVRDAEADPAVSSPYTRARQIKGIIGAPMRIGEKVIGVVHVDFLVSREFSPYEERLLEVVAERAALAIYQAELLEEARRRATQIEAILDNMVDGVFVCDASGQIILANGAAIRLLGLRSVDEAKRPLAGFLRSVRIWHLDGRPFTPEEMPLSRALTGETVPQEDLIVFNLQTQRDVYVRASAAPIRDESGNIAGAVAVAKDITGLMELDRLKDQFLSVAAHELKTPVTAIKGYAQLVLRRETAAVSPAGLKALEAINRQADRITRLINDLLQITRIQAGRLELRPAEFDISELAAEVVERTRIAAERHRLLLKTPGPVFVDADRDRIEQVLENLLDNAIKYSPRGGDVEMTVGVVDGEAVVSVRDYGIGIPKDRQAPIFERFYRAHTGTPYDYGGMGVGLYISKEIIAHHGGRMWFESEEGEGSTFYFGLPVYQGGGLRVEG